MIYPDFDLETHRALCAEFDRLATPESMPRLREFMKREPKPNGPFYGHHEGLRVLIRVAKGDVPDE